MSWRSPSPGSAAVLAALLACCRAPTARPRLASSSRSPTPRPISIRASDSTRRRRSSISCSSARCSGSTTRCASSPDLAERFEPRDRPDLRRRDPARRPLPRRPRADVRRRRRTRSAAFSIPRSCPGARARIAVSRRWTRVDRYTVGVPPQARRPRPSRSTWSWASCRRAPGRDAARASRSAAGRTGSRSSSPDDHVTLTAVRRITTVARPPTADSCSKVVPDDTMRGLELRKGSVDLVVNDLSPDLVHGLREEGRLAVVTGRRAPTTRTSASTCAIQLSATSACAGDRLRDRSRRDRHVPAPRPRPAGHRHRARRCRGRSRPTSVRFTHDPDKARALLDEAGYPDPDGPGPAAAAAPDAQDVDRRARTGCRRP